MNCFFLIGLVLNSFFTYGNYLLAFTKMKRLLILIVFLIAIIQSIESKTLFSSSIYSPQDTLFGARLKSPIQSERANIVCQGCSIDSDLEVDGDTYIVEDYVTIENGGTSLCVSLSILLY